MPSRGEEIVSAPRHCSFKRVRHPMTRTRLLSPVSLPVYGFALTILAGASLLKMPFSLDRTGLSWIDALFTSTSAVCVTGLTVVDTGTHFSTGGHAVLLLLIQAGGLGVMTYSSLVFYLWRRRVTMTDRIAVGQSLLHDPTFHLGRFLFFMVSITLLIELTGAFSLHAADPAGFGPFSALFHAVSAFCNAGFSLYKDNLMPWRTDWWVNITIMLLITLGGLGFSVLGEVRNRFLSWIASWRRGRTGRKNRPKRLTLHARVVLRTSLYLALGGGLIIFLAEEFGILACGRSHGHDPILLRMLSGLFQSVSCRTAGFNTVDIGQMTNISLLFMILLMFIGGSPGSCAGGIKTTTFRSLLAFIGSQVKGRSQTVVGPRALDPETLNKALVLVVFSFMAIFGATFLLCLTEGAAMGDFTAKGQVLSLLFEVVSAFGTVGLSTGITPELSQTGKLVLIVMMFIGRLGPIVFLSMLQTWQSRPHFAWPEESLMIG